MALGCRQRDYTITGRAINRMTLKHIELTKKYIEEGLSKEDASLKAYDKVVAMKINGRK